MATGDIEVYGPFPADDTAAIDAGLTGNSIVVADTITSHVKEGMVYFVVVKA